VNSHQGATKEKSSSGFSLSFNERLDKLSDFVLLVARKLAGLVENLSQFACWSLSTRSAPLTPDKKIRRHAEGVGKRRQLLGTQGHRLSFPVRDHSLGCPQLFGELKLCQARALACAGQSFSKTGSSLLGWSSCCHTPTIPDVEKIIRNRLHEYTHYVYFAGMSKSLSQGLTGSASKTVPTMKKFRRPLDVFNSEVLQCSFGHYPWDDWERDALAAGVPKDLAGLGRLTVREAYQHDWNDRLKSLCGWYDRGRRMIKLALRSPATADKRWDHLLATDGLRGEYNEKTGQWNSWT